MLNQWWGRFFVIIFIKQKNMGKKALIVDSRKPSVKSDGISSMELSQENTRKHAVKIMC